jgi:hypothetical protein
MASKHKKRQWPYLLIEEMDLNIANYHFTCKMTQFLKI